MIPVVFLSVTTYLLQSYSVIFFSFLFFCFTLFFCFYGEYVDMFVNVDYFSFLLLFVTLVIFFMCFFSENFSYLSFFTLCIIIFLLLVRFSVMNYLLFFFCFEFVFILIFFFLLLKGSSIERLQASFYMFFYTMVFSLPFLVGLCILQNIGFSRFFSLYFSSFDSFIVFFLFFVFLVKMPLYGLHLWLPKAHVQASVRGSILLAGVLLKLGGYGIFRFFFMLDNFSFNRFLLPFIFYLSLYGGLLVRITCVRQRDLKILIAYSSVVHMSVSFLGLLRFSRTGVLGCLLILIRHGFISPLIFYLITYMYTINSSRRLFLIKGVIFLCPMYCFFWFIRCSLNLSLPPFISFISELYIFRRMGMLDFLSLFFIFLLLFFSGVYCIFCYSIPSHGSYFFMNFYRFSLMKMFLRFFIIIFVFIYPFLFFWLYSL